MSDDEADNFCFGQKEPPLVDYVKQILRNYTEGQLLKELTQNADDAGAATVKFIYDGRQHKTDRLYCGEGIGDLSPYQGPALCAFNDATFQKNDWTSIQNLSRSEKKDDPTKVGRFGMGFVSVYHVTDMPSILSGNYLAFMDPSETLFKHEGRVQRGRQIHKRSDIFKQYEFADQFSPYKNLFEGQPGLIEGQSFDGAMFRFPLRYRPSVISENVVNGDEVRNLLHLFVDDAKILLLFLKNICSITVGEKRTGTEGHLFSALISSETKDTVHKSRKDIITSIRNNKRLKNNKCQTFSTIFPMIIEINECMMQTKYKWLLSIYLGGSDITPEMFTLATEFDRLPLVGVAMQVFSGYAPTVEGRTFCFLPLPPSENNSGLPVHVNADFGVSDDRRSIKWPVQDRNDKMSKWNRLLLQHLFPKAYVKLILRAIQLYGTGEDDVSVECVYQTWPDVERVKFPWKELMCPGLFNMLLKEDVFFSEIGNGMWINIDNAVFDDVEIQEETRKLLVRLLLENNVPIVSTRNHPHIMNAVKLYGNTATVSITPRLAREKLRNVPLGSLTSKDKIALLEYFLDDGDFADLRGFELLPLADGSFCEFTSIQGNNTVFYATKECSMNLLPGLCNRFIDEGLEESLRERVIDGSRKTGINQIQKLKPTMISTLIREALPDDWLTRPDVIWYPGGNGHPPRYWLERFWNFLQKVCKDPECDIRKYEGITLIPTNLSQDPTRVKLVQLKRNSHLVVSNQYSHLDSRFAEILPLLHLIPVYVDDADFVTFPQSQTWNMYFHRADPNDILRIFAEAGTIQGLQNDVDNLSADHVRLLRSWFKDVRDIKDLERNILVNIAVFQKATYVLGSSNRNTFQSAVANNKELRTVSKDDLPADGFLTEEILLDTSDEDSKNLASKLCLKPRPREDVLCQMVRCTLRDNVNLTPLVIWIMDRWDEFNLAYKQKIRYELKDKPFIPLRNGSLKRASDCFDPSDDLLTKLFSGHCDIFPTPPFDTNYQSILREFGLKTRSGVATEDVRRCVEEIMSHSDIDKGYALLELLDDNPRKFLIDISYLQHQQWVPVEKVTDSNTYPTGFPLFNSCRNLVSPNDAKSVSCAPLVGSTLPLVSSRFHELSRRFEWESNFQPDSIYVHLQNIVKYVSEQNEIGNHVDTPSIERILHGIYKHMQTNLADFKSFSANEDKLVWTGQRFIAPTKLSIQKTRHSLEPYVFTLHPGFSGYKRLFSKFGAIEKYDEIAESMLCLFEEIKTFHETPGNPEVTHERINHDRDLAIQVIDCIIDLNNEILTDEARERIFLPVAAPNEDGLQFASCDDVCFPNEEWLELDEFDDIKLVHEKVSRKIYNCLGVIPLGQKISGAMSLLGFQQAGQKEDLTQKLRNILDSGYTEDSIAKEMIQNADDAGATEVRFMVDMRRNSAFNSRLLDKGMKAWHGPALWVYNDATFSDADFDNITKIGGRTKESKKEQIGTFGLGFNSVYHITDVPSFLSRGIIGFLDPHTKFLDSQLKDKRNPGIRIDLNRSKITLKRFENQFKPYQGVFDCNIFDTNEVNLDGTLFRLPLRLRSIDSKSQISEKCFEEGDILRLMQNVNTMSEKLLLFTQHVTRISVHYLGDQQEPQHAVQLFSVTKRPEHYMKEINKSLKEQSGKKKFEMQNCILHEASQFLLNKTNATEYPSSLTKLSIEHCLTQEGARRFRSTSAEHCTNEWIVSSNMGQSKALDIYTSDTSRYKIPCGGIALPVLSNLKQGEVFCFLPLSIPTTGIPCHINGNFEVSNDRRSLWRRGTLPSVKDIKSDWNDAIFSDIITRSYASLLTHKDAQTCLGTDSVYGLWPDETQIPDQCEYFPLLKAFYRAIAHGIDNLGEKPCVFINDDKWLNIDSIVIYKPDNQAIADDVKKVLQRFIPLGMYVVDVPDKVVNGFNRAGCGDYVHQKIYTEERFFEEIFFPNITEIENEIRNKLTMHVIDCYKRPLYRQLLESTACIPTDNASRRLEKISAVVHPHGKVSELFEPEENLFPIASFQKDETRMEVMVELGMIKDDMTLPKLLERARVFEKSKHQRQHKIKKMQCFVKILETKQRIIDKKFIDDLLCIHILPVLKRPTGLSFSNDFPWHGDECDDFLCAEDLYPADDDLVCFVKPIIDEVVFQRCQNTESVRRIFNLSKQLRTPSCQDVIQQLKKLTGIQNEYLVGNESIVLRLCKTIYSNLERRLQDSSNDDIDELCTGIWPWVWNGEGFSCTSSVCVNEGSVDLRPYHFSVHRSLRSHKQLLQHCNVALEQSEQISYLVCILHKLKEKHDIGGINDDVERDRRLVIQILTTIFERHRKEDMTEHLKNVLIPVKGEELRLVKPDECCFCDDWSKQSLDVEHDENLVHENVANTTAEFFGVIPLSRKLSHSHEIGITQCGQEEPLTQRLHNILQDYQAIDIPKEMIQNADDAEASEVKFLIDLSRNSNTQGLLGKGMALCHGPALCVFNDAMFTNDDFENITKLGGQTKRKQTEKIGKFGLGFNSVYHLTDVPSFISNGRLTIFDPHRFHLGNQVKSGAPGIQIKFRDNPTTLTRFNNQFQPYNNLFGCDLHRDSFTGTLFRLPLRTNQQVQEGGKISRRTFGETEITELITRFCKQAGEMLIFTKHVQRMSIYCRKGYDDEPDCICNVVKEVIGERKSGSMYKIRITVAFPNSCSQLDKSKHEDWIIIPVQGTNEALTVARSSEGVKHGLDTRGGLAYKCGSEEIDSGLVFCFLPLSIPSSRLPIHINAKFSVAPDRRSLRKKGSGDDITIHSEWNNALMKDVIARGYVTMLSEPTTRSLVLNDVLNNRKKDGLFSLWPRTDHVHTDILHVVHSFYQAIVHGTAETDLPHIFNVNQDWYTFNGVCFLDAELTCCRILPEVKDIMIRNGFVIIDLPDYIRKSFEDSNCSDELKMKTVSYRQFFEDQFFAKLTELPDVLANKVVLYLLHNKSDWIDEQLKCTPCIPSTPDGARKLPSDLIDQSCHIIASMYLPEDGKFPLGNEFKAEDIAGRLRSLGMSHSSVPFGYVVERCRSIEIRHQSCCSNESMKICSRRASAILRYIDSIKISDENVTEIKSIKFIPTETQAPINYPVIWGNSEDLFSSPECLYISDLAECVGAVAPIAKQLLCSISTKRKIKMKLTPDLMDVLTQMEHLVSTNCTDIGRVQRMYEHLMRRIQNFKSRKETIKESLQNLEVVLCSGKFMKIEHVALRCNREFVPYLYKLPIGLQKYQDVYKLLGIEEVFSYSTLLDICYYLQNKYDRRPLEGPDLQVAVDMVHSLADYQPRDGDVRQILVPDKHGRLMPVDELSFCLHDCSDDDIQGEILCHDLIPHKLAATLGIKDIRSSVLLKNGIRMKLAGEYGTRFGQVQRLTSRIGEILKGYPCDDSIFKELLQNSDDAGADEINFIYDPRHHPDKKVFCDSWKETLGPALCVFNNRPFTEDDLKGIQDLGIGSKSVDPDKTGQYGIGFNSVYHLTDCPSFLTNDDTMCIFDPHCAFIDHATPDSPGYQYNISPRLNNMFRDALSCFRLDSLENKGCTMFRFPLRTTEMNTYVKDMGLPSMSQEIFDGGKLQTLLEKFKLKAIDMLLYLNNLTTIKISHIDRNNQMKTDYWVKAELSPEDGKRRQEFYNYVKECAKKSKLTEIKMKEATYEMRISDNMSGKTQVWLVNQRIGPTGQIPDSVSSAYDEGHLKLLPRGGVAACTSQISIFPCAYCFLPLPINPGLPVNINGHFSLDSSRRNLSNISTNSDWNSYVKCEVIAHSYSRLLEHLRDKMFGSVHGSKSQITCTPHDLNNKMELYWRYFPNIQVAHCDWKQLAKHVFLVILRNRIPLFPVVRHTDDVICYTSKKNKEINYSLEWFPAIGTTGRKAYFYMDYMSRSSVSEVLSSWDTKKKMLLKPILQHIGFKLANVPIHIHSDLTNAESLLQPDVTAAKCQSLEVELVSPRAVVQFLKTEFEPGPLPCDVIRSRLQSKENYLALLEYIDKDRELQEGKIPLDSMPLLLTQDSCLRRFDTRDAYFHSKKHTLLPKCLHEFVHEHAYSHFSDKSPQIIKFGLADLVKRLDSNLDPQYKMISKVAWKPKSKEIPNATWIQELWAFLKGEFENCKCFPNSKGEERYNHIKLLMGNWAVFPVNVTISAGRDKRVNKYLMPFSSADSVLHSSIPDSYIKDALAKMELPVVDNSIFPRQNHFWGLIGAQSDVIDFIIRFIATAHTPGRILTSLVSLLDENDRAFYGLNESDKKNILLFFERFIGSHFNGLDKQHINPLRMLPCYRSIHNEYISLSQNKQQFVLHSGIPEVDKEQWVNDTEAVFIEDDPTLKKLHALLGLKKSTELDVYKRFILPLFHKLTHKGRIEHMQRIKFLLQFNMTYQSVTYCEQRQLMIWFMKDIPLISHEGQSLKQICEYFDNTVTIFKQMLEPDKFLPEPFCTADWHQLMIELGLQTKPTPEMILKFAKEIETGMNSFDFKNQTVKSEELIKHVANSEELKKNVNFLGKLRGIAFLAPCRLDQNLLILHKRFKEHGRVGIAYDGALTHDNVHLVWTSANILPTYALPYVDERYGKRFNGILPTLNASSTPSLDLVLQHTKNICSYLKEEYSQSKGSASGATSSECQQVLHKVMRNIYEYVSKLCRENSSTCAQVVKELNDMPIMLVDDDTILIQAKYTVKTLQKDLVLTPYMCDIPECFVQYMDLFSRLGAEEKPSIWQWCELLKMIHEDIKDRSFSENPNLMSGIKFAVRKIFKSYEKTDWLKDIGSLYLPNRRCQLVESSTLMYYDKPMFEIRMNEENNNKNILCDLRNIGLENDATDYIENMPTELKPGKFSKQVIEIMESNPEESKCRHANEGLCEQLNFIRHQVQSKEFRHGIYRLLRHEANQNRVELPGTVLSNVPQLSREQLSIECLNKLQTHLVQSGKLIEGSMFEQDCFLQRLADHMTIFIRHQYSETFELLKLMLVDIICELTKVSDKMTVAMMVCSDLGGIPTLLSKRNIQKADANTSESMSLPELGSRVPDDIVASLDSDPFNEFAPGEYVAYELDEQGEEVFVYAKIIRKISRDVPGCNSIKYLYEIDYGHIDNREVSAFDLYKWLPGSHNENVKRALQIYVAPESREESIPIHHDQRPSTPPMYGNLEEAKDNLSDKLEEIWKLGPEERKKAVRRLYLKWHPDKNPGHEEFCCEVFKHLKNEIDRLEKGLPRQQSNGERSSERNYSSDFRRWDDAFRRWNRRAGRDKRKREYYGYGNSYGGGRSSFGSSARFANGSSFSSGFWTSSGFTFNTSATPRPMPDEARLWQSQAHEDLRAAQNDINGYPSYEWVAYKCMQAAEKSLKAAILSSTGMSYRTHNITWLSITVGEIPGCPDDLRKYVDELCAYGKNQNSARYPLLFDNEIPHNIYRSEDAAKCMSNAKKIVNMMDSLIASKH